MSVYQGKILELVAIENRNEKSCLHIKLFSEQEVELFWEIDENTAESLLAFSNFDSNDKYRLSLHTTWDINKNKYIGQITKTHRENSEHLYFSCSEEFKNQLDSFKNTQSFYDLNLLPFLSINLSTNIEKRVEQKNVVATKEAIPSLKWFSVAVCVVILAVLFGYSNSSYLNNASISHTTIAHAEVKTEKKNINSKKIPNKVSGASTAPFSRPYIKVNDFLTYSLPKGYVALTFDDGPSKYTEKIVDILKKYQVGGTFFFIGYNVEKYPSYVQYTYTNGYSIGSHSMHHPEMANLPYGMQKNELLQSIQTIKNITHNQVTLFRPPYESLNAQTKEVLHEYNEKLILWNRDPEDWKFHDPNKMLTYVRSTGPSGAVILFHESQAVLDALPKVIEYLQGQKLKMVNLQ